MLTKRIVVGARIDAPLGQNPPRPPSQHTCQSADSGTAAFSLTPFSTASAYTGYSLSSRCTTSLTIGGIPTKVLYFGLAPGFPGLYQLDVQVPSGVVNGDDIPVLVTMAGNFDTATVSIQPRSKP